MRQASDDADLEGYTAEQLALDARHFFEAGNMRLAKHFARLAKERARRNEWELLDDVNWILKSARRKSRS